MSTITIPKILANFETSLAATMSAAATTCTLNASVDGDGTTLSGLYSLTFDEGTASEEHMLVTMTGASGSISRRGLSRVDAYTEVTANKFVHNRGASVKVTNVSAINIQRLLNGDDSFNSPAWTGVASISGLSTPTSSETTKAANIAYVNAVSIAGANDASTTVKGITEEATQAEIAAGTAAGGTSARLFANPSTLAPHVQSGAWLYAAEDGSGSDDTYTAALTPALTAYTTGMTVLIKLTVANTGACTLNLNSLGAKTIKKYAAGALADTETGDIIANQSCMFYYDGTYMVLLNPTSAMPTVANLNLVSTNIGTLTAGSSSNASALHKHSSSFKLLTYDMSTASGTSTIAHSLGVTPRIVKITSFAAISASVKSWSIGSYDGTTTQSNTIDLGASATETSSTYAVKVGRMDTANYQTATVAYDGTNVTLTWTKTGTPTGNAQLFIESYA